MSDRLIRLPWPPSATSPNASGQGRWRKKTSAAKAYKDTCAKECLAQSIAAMDCEYVWAEITYCPPTKHRIDWDNMAARCKQGFDAVAEAVGVDDGRWWPVVSQRGDKVKGGCVLVHLKPVTSESGTLADVVNRCRDIPLEGGIS